MFDAHLASKGTVQKLTIYDMPEYNGVAKCLNRTLLEQTCVLLHSSKLPKNLWGEEINHSVWLKNRTTTCALPSSDEEAQPPYLENRFHFISNG